LFFFLRKPLLQQVYPLSHRPPSHPPPLSSLPCTTTPPPLEGENPTPVLHPTFYILYRPSSIIPWNYLFPPPYTTSHIYRHLLTPPPYQPNSPISGPFPCKTALLNPQPQQLHRQQLTSGGIFKKKTLGSRVGS
jgi:hypothetical protein